MATRNHPAPGARNNAPGRVPEPPQGYDDDEFAEGGERSDLAELWKPESVGDALIGHLAEIRSFVHPTFGSTMIAEFDRCVIREGGAKAAYRGIAIVLTRALQQRIKQRHVGEVLSVIFTGEVPAGKDGRNTLRTYDVRTQSPAKLRAMLAEVGADDLPF